MLRSLAELIWAPSLVSSLACFSASVLAACTPTTHVVGSQHCHAFCRHNYPYHCHLSSAKLLGPCRHLLHHAAVANLVTLGTSHATKAETDSRCRCQECLTALTYDMAVDNLTTELVQHENNLRLDAIHCFCHLMSKATCSACMQLCLILHFTP